MIEIFHGQDERLENFYVHLKKFVFPHGNWLKAEDTEISLKTYVNT